MTDDQTPDAQSSVVDSQSADLLSALDTVSADLQAVDRWSDDRLKPQAEYDERARLRNEAVTKHLNAVAAVAARAATAAEAAHGELRWFDPEDRASVDVAAAWQFAVSDWFKSDRADDWLSAVAHATPDDLAAALRYGPGAFRARWRTDPQRAEEATNGLEQAVIDRWFTISGQRPAVEAFQAADEWARTAASIAAELGSGRVRNSSQVAQMTGSVRALQVRALARKAV